MKLRRACLLLALAGASLLASAPALAQSSSGSVGLGVAAGLAFPGGGTPGIASDGQPSFDWGFYVNIPLISTFHLTPSAELYRFGDQNATDICLAFKFMIPLSRFDLYLGVTPGLTATGAVTAGNVGLLAGGAFWLAGNLDLFVQARYQWVFEGGGSLGVLHLNAGVLFVF